MKCKVVKGGWAWLGIVRNPGDIIDAPSEQWIANRIADGLVEPVADAPVERAVVKAPEKAVAQRKGNR